MPENITHLPVRFNIYNTTDPSQLLELKRQEADAMLEVVRAMHPGIEAEELIFIVVNTIRRQLGVVKLMLVISDEEARGKEVEVNYGFAEPTLATLDELNKIQYSRPVNPTDDPLLIEMGVEHVIPLGAEDFMNAWFLIADFAESEEETENDIVFIETIGNILVMTLQNIQLFEEKLIKERIQQELHLAGSIQRLSLPSDFNYHPALDIHAENMAHSSVGGDFFNVLKTGDDEIHFFIADAAGKGVAAALLITNIQANLNALINIDATHKQIVNQLHDVIGKLTNFEAFVTLFMGKINLKTNTLTYLNAGHNPPLLHHKGEWVELRDGCIPLGIMPIEDFNVGEVDFEPGDFLFTYTDGVVEQNNPKDELFGEARIEQFLKDREGQTPEAIIKEMFEALHLYAQGEVDEEPEPFQDDITMLAIRHVKND